MILNDFEKAVVVLALRQYAQNQLQDSVNYLSFKKEPAPGQSNDVAADEATDRAHVAIAIADKLCGNS